jgi:uncharacterized RDD family membrane protein YckC
VTDQQPPPEGTVPGPADIPVPADVPATAEAAVAATAAEVPAPVEAPAPPVAPAAPEVVAPVVAAAAAPVAAAAYAAPPPQQPTTWSGYQPPAGPAGAAGPGGPAPGWAYAGFWIRAVAWIIDGFILGIITTFFWVVVVTISVAIGIGAVGTVSTDTTLTDQQAAVLGLGILTAITFLGVLTLLITVLYFVLLWVKRGATIGQSILGLRVARERDGGPIGWGAALLRYIMLMIGFWIFYLGVIWVAFEPRKRGWHDMVAGTLVVKRS